MASSSRAFLALGHGRGRGGVDRSQLCGHGAAGLLIDLFAHRRRVIAKPVDRFFQDSDKICHAFVT